MDDLSYILEQGVPGDALRELLQKGFQLAEIAASVRDLVARGVPLMDPAADAQAKPECFNGKKFLHNVLGDYLIEKYHCCKINGSVHIYDGGVYRAGEDALHTAMIDLFPSISDAQRRETFKYIRVCRQTPVRELSPPHLIPLRSKIYNLQTGEFLDYSPAFTFLNRFPYDYDPDAPEAPLISETLGAIANGDEGIRALLLEAFGNCFYLLNSYRGAVMLYGPAGNNGKSTLLNMLAQMIGRENASYLSLQDTAEKFRLIEMYGKAANIGDDIPDACLLDSSLFKKLVTGETVMAEKKGRDPIAFRPSAKLFFALNTLPPVSDRSRAFFSRVLLVPLAADFSVNGDPALKDRVWSEEEMAYLVRLSMEGLRRLRARGSFTRPDCVRRAMWEYQVENDPVLGFLSEYKGIVGQPIQMVYDDFRAWCAQNGHRGVLTRLRFTRQVCNVMEVQSDSLRHPYFGTNKTGRCFVSRFVTDCHASQKESVTPEPA